jgi:hypothetical protein
MKNETILFKCKKCFYYLRSLDGIQGGDLESRSWTRLGGVGDCLRRLPEGLLEATGLPEGERDIPTLE